MFSNDPKPLEVEILVVEVGEGEKLNEIYRISFDGSIIDERGVAAMGGAPPNPGKIRALRKNIARILTIMREEELAGSAPAPAKAAPGKAAPSGEET